MIWRDDDVGAETRGLRLAQLERVDDVFQAHGVPHTVAVIAQDLETNTAVIDCIRMRRMVPQLHGWTHADLTADSAALAALPQAVDLLTAVFAQRPTVLYPPWNRRNADVDAAADALGLRVSTEKVSLEQFLRVGGMVAEDTVNFHYWHDEETVHLDAALRLEVAKGRPMKSTDYCPRAAPFDTYLTGRDLVGVEVGVDAGAHAEALLRHCDIARLTLIDPWPKDYPFGFCEGRLSSLGLRSKFRSVREPSLKAAAAFAQGSLDFVYIDQVWQDGAVVTADLKAWWPMLKVGGVLGYRNYVDRPTPLVQAVDAFVKAHGLTPHVETGEIVLVKTA